MGRTRRPGSPSLLRQRKIESRNAILAVEDFLDFQFVGDYRREQHIEEGPQALCVVNRFLTFSCDPGIDERQALSSLLTKTLRKRFLQLGSRRRTTMTNQQRHFTA